MTHHGLASPGVWPGGQEVGRGLQRQYVHAGVRGPSGPAIKYSQTLFNGEWGFGVLGLLGCVGFYVFALGSFLCPCILSFYSSI